MANVKAAIYAHLKTKGAVTSIVGTGDNLRVYPGRIPDRAGLPYIRVYEITGTREHELAHAVGLVEGRVQFDCWDDDPLSAYSLADAVRGAMDHIAFGTVVGGVTLQGSHVLDMSEITEFTEDLEAADRYGYRVEVTVWYQE